MRPGCVLLQATFGCEGRMADHFDTKHWLLAPTDNLKVYDVTEDQLKQLVKMTEKEPVT